jgi:hypothetical protein
MVQGRSLPATLVRVLLPAVLAGSGALVLTRLAQPPVSKHDVVVVSQMGTRAWYPADRAPRLPLPDGQALTVRSMLNVTNAMHYGDYVWDEKGVPAGPIRVRVDLSRQVLSVFRGEHEIGTAVILYGTDGKPTPTGLFPVLEKAVDHHSSLYDAPMPYMMRLTGDGVALHASNVRRGYATHGCIGLPIEFAKLLYRAIKPGDPVAIMAGGETGHDTTRLISR